MTLSRTARILIALLLLSAAAFFWVNFFSRPSEPVQAERNAAPIDASAQAAPPAVATSPNTGVTATDAGATAPTTATAAPSDATEGPVVVPASPDVATRDLVVSDLPFLVTEPPAAGAADQTQAAANGGATRPQGAQRMSVNPFSPILVRAPAAAQPTATAQAASPQVVQVETPAQPAAVAGSAGTNATATRELVQAPAPRPIAPPSSPTASLPRELPGGTLPSTPEILRTARTEPRATAPTGLGRLAAVREPDAQPLDQSLATAGGTTTASGTGVPAPLGPAQPAADATAAAGTPGAPPLEAGTNNLSRYLRDHNVRFTGTVLGPVSVGVFRSALYATPVVLALGQSLPDTQIVLTDLRGHEAQFSMDDSTQTLSLDLRR